MKRILIGGSPCTHWSIAQSKNRETTPSGIGWELFRNYLIAKERYKPDFFLYENNVSAAAPIKAQIRKELDAWDIDSRLLVPGQAQYIEINSALVSAQSRKRFYCHNFPGVFHPEDRGILLRDVLESGYVYSEKAYTLRAQIANSGQRDFREHAKNRQLGTQGVFEAIRIGTIENEAIGNYDSKQYRVYSSEAKATTLCGEGGGLGAKTGLYAVPVDTKHADGKVYPIYEVRGGLITIKGEQYPIKLPDGYYIIRKLTVNECRRLQTIPEWYVMPCSNSQNYKMLGNGWTVEVIKHIMQSIAGEEVEVLSMYDGMSCGRIALEELGCKVKRYYAYEIDKYAIQTSQANFPDTIQLGDAFGVATMNFDCVTA